MSSLRRPVKEKKQLFGKHRIAVGGQNPDGEICGRKSDTTVEPVFFHQGPQSLEEELIHSHSVGAVNDLTPGLEASTPSHACVR